MCQNDFENKSSKNHGHDKFFHINIKIYFFMKSLTIHEFEPNIQNAAEQNRGEQRRTEERTEEKRGEPRSTKGSGGDLHTRVYYFLESFIENHVENIKKHEK